jgi:SNF2 family DNA or RNA helicase
MQIPDTGPSLMLHQEDCTQHLVKRSSPGEGTLVAMGARLGKSVSTVEAAYRTGKKRILVVSPVTIIDGWVEEVHKWWRGGEMPIRKAHGQIPSDTLGWTFTNYETLRGKLEQVSAQRYLLHWLDGWDLIVFDESVKIKSRKAQNTHAAECLVRQNPQATIWLLSANPAPKDLSDLWTQLQLVDPLTAGASFWRFAARYCFVEQDQWGTKVTGNQPGAEEQIYADFGGAIWRPDPNRVPTLTPIQVEVKEVELTGDQLRVYTEMEGYFKALLDQQTGDTLLAPNTMVQGIRLMQLASNPALVGGLPVAAKWRYMLERLEMATWEEPTIIWTAFKETVKQLGEAMRKRGWSVAELTGDTSQKKRTEVRHAFQNGEVDVLLAHPGVGKFGLNLSAANSVVWLEKSWPADDYYQASFRARHLHKHSTVHQLELLALANGQPTIDHAVHNLLKSRVTSTRKLTATDVLKAWTR